MQIKKTKGPWKIKEAEPSSGATVGESDSDDARVSDGEDVERKLSQAGIWLIKTIKCVMREGMFGHQGWGHGIHNSNQINENQGGSHGVAEVSLDPVHSPRLPCLMKHYHTPIKTWLAFVYSNSKYLFSLGYLQNSPLLLLSSSPCILPSCDVFSAPPRASHPHKIKILGILIYKEGW